MLTRYSWMFAACGVMAGCGTQVVKAKGEDPATRSGVELTVYKEDFSMVREQRPVSLPEGRSRVRITDVSRQLDPSSVLFTWPSNTAQVVASTYDLGTDDGQSLLKRYLGQPVDMVWYGEDGQPGQKVSGTLQVAGDSGTVLESDGKFYVNPKGTIVAPANPDVVTIPQLTAQVESKSKQDTKLSVAYLTRGLGWSADYVATLDSDSSVMNLEAWATVTNMTGAAFPDAKITLVAGSPNRSTRMTNTVMAGANFEDTGRFRAKPADLGLSPEASGELYAYPVPSTATISPDQMNRVRLLSSPRVSVKRVYTMHIGEDAYWNVSNVPMRQNAQLAVNFVNSQNAGLGMPLPGGTVRVYEPGASGTLAYVGAAAIPDTPKDERASLTLTNVFDVTGHSRMMQTKKLGKRRVQRDYQAILRNAKTKPIDLHVTQTFGNQWRIVSESVKSTRPDSSTALWIVRIPAGGQTKLTYSVVQSW
jgi:hypothetical protein